jgi:two-component system chemotaxis response regulator CheB
MNANRLADDSFKFPVIAVAASAGGLRALERVFAHLPAALPAAIVVVQHLDRKHPSLLAQLLGRHTALRVLEARDGDSVQSGSIYVAPPDRHLLVRPDATVELTRTEPVNYVRPCADLTFASIAHGFGKRAIAVVLTGTGHDGAAGAAAIKAVGGIVIAQNEATSEFFSMPEAAIHTGFVDFVLPLEAIGPKLVDLTTLVSHQPS